MSFLDKMRDIKINESKIYTKPTEIVIPKSFISNVVSSDNLSIIAEVKKASPSKGIIATDINPIEQAKRYESGGAKAVSVLTESEYFLGCYEDLYEVASSVNVPVLCKDFIFFSHQLHKARDFGASIVLLIAAGLETNALVELEQEAIELGMEVLLEVHDEADLEKIQLCKSKLVGVNNRNLRTLEVSLETSQQLLPLVNAEGKFAISESGILQIEDAQFLKNAGAKGLLIGEALMKNENPEIFLKELLSL